MARPLPSLAGYRALSVKVKIGSMLRMGLG
jgi:hypothetical protein